MAVAPTWVSQSCEEPARHVRCGAGYTHLHSRVAQIAASRKAASALQGSLVAMSPQTGDVYALVGGRDFRESSFNRATQARRQAGSAFKPIIYAAALERGYAPGTLLKDLDTPIEGAESWMPGGEHERADTRCGARSRYRATVPPRRCCSRSG